MRSATLLLLLLWMSVAFPLVTGIHIEPVKASWSGWAPSEFPNNYVSQSITCNFDEPICAEYFTGVATNQQYQVELRLPPGPGGTIFAEGNAYENRSHVWVRCSLDVLRPDLVTKGKLYEVRWTLSGGTDSLMYYYDSTDCYRFGGMAVGQQVPIPNPNDLACRVYGRMNPVTDVWRAVTNHGNNPPPDTEGLAALRKAQTMGINWLRDDFLCWGTWDSSRDEAMSIYNRYDSAGFSMVGILCYGSNDSTQSSGPPGAGSWGKYPPRYLWPESGQTNYWARYCRSIMESMPVVKYWEVFPEANADWYWKDPDTHYYHGSSGLSYDPIDTPRERCSLYVRMCRIAESTARVLGGELRRKVIGGAPIRLVDPQACTTGVGWLSHVLDLATSNYGSAESCFDAVSVHAYMWYPPGPYEQFDFTEGAFHRDLDTARWVMRQAGYPEMELWASEYGWPRWKKNDSFRPYTDTLQQARNVGKFYVSAVARQADPRGGYDRVIHYELTSDHVWWDIDNDGYGLLDSLDNQPPLPHGWAFTQLDQVLTAKRLNGRVMTGDTAIDNYTRVYEFEDTTAQRTRTWVCWQDEAVAAYTPLPVRSDTVDTVALAYDGSPPADDKDAENSGWLHIALDPRPAFVTEKSAASRPDLVVDSVRYYPPLDPIAVRAWVKNRGNRATPHRFPGNQPYPTWAVLHANGDSLAETEYSDSIPADSSVVFEFPRGAMQMPQTALLSVVVNPGQSFVELATDDNSGYALKAQ